MRQGKGESRGRKMRRRRQDEGRRLKVSVQNYDSSPGSHHREVT